MFYFYIGSFFRFGKGNTMTMLATPTPVQERAFELLGVTPTAEL